jgi:hypothetical protein
LTGLLTIVPYGTYYLFYEATRDQYALLITLVLFWIFGYWSLVGPILAAVKVRKVFRVIELARSKGELVKVLQSQDANDAAIDLIASENRIPRFLASRVYDLLVKRFSELKSTQDRSALEEGE